MKKEPQEDGAVPPPRGGRARPDARATRCPPEWAKHESTWLSWPEEPPDLPPRGPPRGRGRIRSRWSRRSRAGERGRPPRRRRAGQRTACGRWLSAKNVIFHRIKERRRLDARLWADILRGEREAPSGVRPVRPPWQPQSGGSTRGEDKYDDLLPDDRTGLEVARSTGLKVFETGVVLEGGSIDVERRRAPSSPPSSASSTRTETPSLGKAQLERLLQDYLGVTSVVWLEAGSQGTTQTATSTTSRASWTRTPSSA